jgi:hypothetical protein
MVGDGRERMGAVGNEAVWGGGKCYFPNGRCCGHLEADAVVVVRVLSFLERGRASMACERRSHEDAGDSHPALSFFLSLSPWV